MIAESTASASPASSYVPSALQPEAPSQARPELSLNRIVATLQVLLASRRAARNEDYAYWYNAARGL
jgi:hypothetical protein